MTVTSFTWLAQAFDKTIPPPAVAGVSRTRFIPSIEIDLALPVVQLPDPVPVILIIFPVVAVFRIVVDLESK